MNGKSEMEILFERYLASSDNFYEKDGIPYWKIICKNVLANRVIITVPRKALDGEKTDYCDEHGNKVFLNGSATFSFGSKEIPKWYLETATCTVSNISSPSDIGDYICKDKK